MKPAHSSRRPQVQTTRGTKGVAGAKATTGTKITYEARIAGGTNGRRKPKARDKNNNKNKHKKADKRKQWTIMVYLAGDNNLSDEMVWALKELYRVGAPAGVTVTVQFDPSAKGSSTRYFRMPAHGIKVDVD